MQATLRVGSEGDDSLRKNNTDITKIEAIHEDSSKFRQHHHLLNPSISTILESTRNNKPRLVIIPGGLGAISFLHKHSLHAISAMLLYLDKQ